MKVDKKLLDKWKDLALFKDALAISKSMPEETRVTEQTIRTLIRTGEYRSLNVLEAVIAFYKERERKVKGLMNDALNDHENAPKLTVDAVGDVTVWDNNTVVLKGKPAKSAANNTFLEKRRADKSKIK